METITRQEPRSRHSQAEPGNEINNPLASSLVTIDRSGDYKLSDVEQAAARILSRYPDFLKRIRGSRILLKPNLLFPDPPPKNTCTHPTVVEAVIRLVLDYGGRPAVGDRPVKGSARRAAQAAGILKVCEKYSVPLVEFKRYKKTAARNAGQFSSLYIARELDDYDLILNLPKLKVHSQLLITCAVKNLFGCVRFSQRMRAHLTAENRRAFVELLIYACRNAGPAFSLVDGITAMHNQGPRGGTPCQLGVLVGGEDPFCVDAVVAAILEMKVESIPILSAARQLGMFHPELVETAGVPINEILCRDFDLPILQPVSFNLYRSGKIFFRQFLSDIFGGNQKT